MAARGGRKLGRALVFAGVALWIPELYLVWTLLYALFTPVRAADGRLAQVHINLNGSAWAALIGWTALCWALIGWGLRMNMRGKNP
jgi:hypothetical protein